MATVYEQTIICTLCGGAQRMTKVDDQKWDYGNWSEFTTSQQKRKFMCPSCIGAIKGIFAECMADWEKTRKKEKK